MPRARASGRGHGCWPASSPTPPTSSRRCAHATLCPPPAWSASPPWRAARCCSSSGSARRSTDHGGAVERPGPDRRERVDHALGRRARGATEGGDEVALFHPDQRLRRLVWVEGQDVPRVDLRLDVLGGGVNEALHQRAVRELDVAVDGGGVGERMQYGAMALEHGDDALDRVADAQMAGARALEPAV